MRKQIGFTCLLLTLGLGGAALFFARQPTSSLANATVDYELNRQVIGFAGGVSAGGDYAVSSAIGQAEADELSGGLYTLGSGVLGGGPRTVAPVAPTATPTPTVTPTSGGVPTTTATVTPTPPGTNAGSKAYLPLVDR